MELRIKLIDRCPDVVGGFLFESELGVGIGVIVSGKEHSVGDELTAELDTESIFELGRNLRVVSDLSTSSLNQNNNGNILTGIVREICDDDTAILSIGKHSLLFEISDRIKTNQSVALEFGPFELYEVEY